MWYKKCFLGYLGETAIALSQIDHFAFAYCKYVCIYSSIQQIPIVCQDWKSLGIFYFSDLVENENHCDFVKLREMLICTNMEDLRDQTHTRHYELYRRHKLEEMGFMDVGPENQPLRWAASYGRREWRRGWYLFICPGWRENLPHHERPLDNDLLSCFLCCLNHWKTSCSWRSPSPHPTQGVKEKEEHRVESQDFSTCWNE